MWNQPSSFYAEIKYYYNNLRYYRLKRHLTLRQLAERTQISPSYLSKIELSNPKISPRMLTKLAHTLDCAPEQLTDPSIRYH